MSRAAIGAYLRTLREQARLTRAEVAEAIDSNETYLVRVERGSLELRASMLFALLGTVGGHVDDVAALLRDPEAEAEAGRVLAEARRHGASGTSGRLDRDVLAIAGRLDGDAKRTGRWIGYGERLAEEREAQAARQAARPGRRRPGRRT